MVISAVIFDLDGVLMDSEQLWDRARRETVEEHDGHWPPGATEAMQGMSSTEWSAYLREKAGLDLSSDQIVESVLDKLFGYYRQDLPLMPGADSAVRRIADRWPVGLASSSNREIIDLVLELSSMSRLFAVTVSSEEVARGKPAPDVYLEAARRLRVEPSRCAAVEDSANGIQSALSAGMSVIALPNPHYPPGPDALAQADLVLPGLDQLIPEAIIRAGANQELRIEHRLDEQEIQSFPASDPHSDWAGPLEGRPLGARLPGARLPGARLPGARLPGAGESPSKT
jgi:HAD superfamily hydrolase (TIGR01509 family)